MAATLLSVACWSFWNNTDDYDARGTAEVYTYIYGYIMLLANRAQEPIVISFPAPLVWRKSCWTAFLFLCLLNLLACAMSPFRCYVVVLWEIFTAQLALLGICNKSWSVDETADLLSPLSGTSILVLRLPLMFDLSVCSISIAESYVCYCLC